MYPLKFKNFFTPEIILFQFQIHRCNPIENCLENKGKWYESQINSTINFKAKYRFLSVLWGHVNYQIEHHLFPDIPSHIILNLNLK